MVFGSIRSGGNENETMLSYLIEGFKTHRMLLLMNRTRRNARMFILRL